MNDTQQNLLDILKEAIAIEIYGKEYYSIFSDLVEEENVKAVFRRLARDEEKHREIVEKEYRKIAEKTIDMKILNEENREKARRVFPESLMPMGVAKTEDVLRLGIRTEERSIELYSVSAQKTGDKSGRYLFLKLVHFEQEHKETLEDALHYFEKEGSWHGYQPE